MGEKGGRFAPVTAYPPPALPERALDFVFPPLCVGCRRVGRWICPRCWDEVTWILDERCGSCGERSATNPCPSCLSPSSPLRRVIAVANFETIAREAVHALKYENRHAISGLMGRLMGEAARQAEGDLVVNVALHRSRRHERGYDQAALLARHAARALTLPFDGGALNRTRRTRQQVTLGPDERRRNVVGAFSARRSVSGRNVLLVDDVYTTGSTLTAAAAALMAAGAKSVTGLVFARAHPGTDRLRP